MRKLGGSPRSQDLESWCPDPRPLPTAVWRGQASVQTGCEGKLCRPTQANTQPALSACHPRGGQARSGGSLVTQPPGTAESPEGKGGRCLPPTGLRPRPLAATRVRPGLPSSLVPLVTEPSSLQGLLGPCTCVLLAAPLGGAWAQPLLPSDPPCPEQPFVGGRGASESWPSG